MDLPQDTVFLTESRIQQNIVRFFKNTYCLSHHIPRCLIMSIPNEMKPRLSQTGLYTGGADLLILHLTAAKRPTKGIKWVITPPVDCGTVMRVIFIEVKTPEGKISLKQRKFETHIRSMKGKVEYYVVRSLEEFQKIILR